MAFYARHARHLLLPYETSIPFDGLADVLILKNTRKVNKNMRKVKKNFVLQKWVTMQHKLICLA